VSPLELESAALARTVEPARESGARDRLRRPAEGELGAGDGGGAGGESEVGWDDAGGTETDNGDSAGAEKEAG
jgi:hypothetical protein